MTRADRFYRSTRQTTQLLSALLFMSSIKRSFDMEKFEKHGDITGVRFGRLIVNHRVGTRGKNSIYQCTCDCGVEKIISRQSLLGGCSKSCGCLQKEVAREIQKQFTTHGMTYSSEYLAWKNMIRRCTKPQLKVFKHYGGRGIQVCEDWLVFENFYKDMGDKPNPKYQLERMDNNGNYCLENCEWVTSQSNNRNKRNNRLVEAEGQIKTLAEWVELKGLTTSALTHRLDRGQAVERALNTPLRVTKCT